MRKVSAFAALCLLANPIVWANTSLTLDRQGVLWQVSSTPYGLLLEGLREGEVVVRTVVPFPLGGNGVSDSHLQLAVDDLTGKVVVAWQRNWAATLSSVMLAVWNGESWERVAYLNEEINANPRNPVLRIARASTALEPSQEASESERVCDSFAFLVWWEGRGASQRLRFAALDLKRSTSDEGLQVYDLPTSPGLGMNCPQPLPADTVERPLFASEPPGPASRLLAASPNHCFLYVFEISLQLEPPEQGPGKAEGGLGVTAQRRRHTPIFGVRKVLPVTRELSAEGTRAVLGADLQPVLYRVLPEGVEYTVATEQGWSAKRLLKLENGLTLDRAIALVENLAR
ncbi:MAG: hypothetical protein NZ869_04460 [Thermoanaerobaculum sp.]|nr:hypothetical protein [Thermoanaerobaculum sp.]MDW7966816.1 hypothetical protein [Thermoanaerobaculum sp.]